MTDGALTTYDGINTLDKRHNCIKLLKVAMLRKIDFSELLALSSQSMGFFL